MAVEHCHSQGDGHHGLSLKKGSLPLISEARCFHTALAGLSHVLSPWDRSSAITRPLLVTQAFQDTLK